MNPPLLLVWWAHGGDAGGNPSRRLQGDVLGSCLGLPPNRLPIIRPPGGKPFLPASAGLDFNLSHSAAVAVLAVSRGQPVGIDVEYCDPSLPILEIIVPRLSASAREQLAARPAPLARAAAYRMWVRYEAAVKCLGHGVDPGAALDQPLPGISLQDLPAPSGHQAALACAGDATPWRAYHWPDDLRDGGRYWD